MIYYVPICIVEYYIIGWCDIYWFKKIWYESKSKGAKKNQLGVIQVAGAGFRGPLLNPKS